MREKPNIPEEKLRTCLQDQYDLVPVTLEFLPRGLDYNAGVYRVVSEHGTSYLLKVKSVSIYKPSCLVPRYLSHQGIASVVAPLPTKRNTLWIRIENWTVIVYPFIEGDTSLTPQSQPTGGGALCCRYANVGATPIEQCTNRLTCPTPGTPLITDIRCETQRCPAL